MQKKILLATNGCQDGWDSVLYAVNMANLLNLPLTLLGVVEKYDEIHPVEEIFGRATTLLQAQKVDYDLKLVNGDTEDVLAEMDWEDETYLFVGPLGRSQFRQWLVGRSFRKILASVPSPIFYIREVRLPIKKILICFSSIENTGRAEEIGLDIGKCAGAEVKFLHVIPPVESEHIPSQELEKHVAEIIDETPARNLKNAEVHAEEKGVPANTVLRHGNIVQQILEEVAMQDYDLICMGSIFSSPDHLRRMYAPNITAEIAEALTCPILTARSTETNS